MLKPRGTSRGLALSPLPPYIQNGRKLTILQTEVPCSLILPQAGNDPALPQPMWKTLVLSQCGSGELTALKKFLNLCSSKPAARRSFGVCSTRSLNLEERRPDGHRGNTGCCCDRQLPGPCQPHRSPCGVSEHSTWTHADPMPSLL